MNPSTSFHLPWNQQGTFWLCARTDSAHLLPSGYEIVSVGCYQRRIEGHWQEAWERLHAALVQDRHAKIALISGENKPHASDIAKNLKPIRDIDRLAANLWLGEALMENMLLCHLQPIVGRERQPFGYEAFARARSADGALIAGGDILRASEVLGVQQMIDRYLHVQAIQSFAEYHFKGMLFVNFIAGFIQRPSVYFEALLSAAASCRIPNDRIVLDFTESEKPQDAGHLKNLLEFSKAQGFKIALDDIRSTEPATKLLHEIKPDFIKLDHALSERAHAKRLTIEKLVNLAHDADCTVIAEGVENEETFHILKELGVDLFQGYWISPPKEASDLA